MPSWIVLYCVALGAAGARFSVVSLYRSEGIFHVDLAALGMLFGGVVALISNDYLRLSPVDNLWKLFEQLAQNFVICTFSIAIIVAFASVISKPRRKRLGI